MLVTLLTLGGHFILPQHGEGIFFVFLLLVFTELKDLGELSLVVNFVRVERDKKIASMKSVQQWLAVQWEAF